MPSGMNPESNPLVELASALEENTSSFPGRVIALIDTGVNGYASNVVEAVSMIGDDVTDYNGHGTAMAGFITEQDPDARMFSRLKETAGRSLPKMKSGPPAEAEEKSRSWSTNCMYAHLVRKTSGQEAGRSSRSSVNTGRLWRGTTR